MAAPSPVSSFSIPPRPEGAMTGSEFGLTIMHTPLGPAREAAIYHELSTGNVPDFMRTSYLFAVVGARCLTLEVLPDVLCVGTNEDFLRVPMNPKTAQRLADEWQASLITTRLSDIIWQQAARRVEPFHVTMPPSAEMTSTGWFIEQNHKIQLELGNADIGIVAGHKKDVVLADTLALPQFHDKCVAIYGWHHRNGVPVQQLNPAPGLALVHEITYADYSHGIRFVAQNMLVNGDAHALADALQDPELAPMLNKDGVLKYPRYPV